MRDREILHEQLGLEKVYNSPDQVLMAKLQRETTISDGPVHWIIYDINPPKRLCAGDKV